MIDVALDARLTRRMSVGTRRYIEELLQRAPRAAPDLRFARVGSGEHFTAAEQIALPLQIARLAPRLVHFMTPLAPAVRPAPYVVTVHDLIPLRFPNLVNPAARPFYATLGRAVVRGAARVCVSDERTAADVERYFAVEGSRCRIVPLGYDSTLLASSDAEIGARPFLLYAGNHRPHKNLGVLLAAFASLPPALELDLYLTGNDDFAGGLRRFGRMGGAVTALGDVAGERLARLYRGALAYVQPSLFEGFGISMLEAAVVGTPVIASDGAVPSVLREAAQVFPAGDAGALRDALLAVAQAPDTARRRAREVAPRLRAYTWDRFAAAMTAVYAEVLTEFE